MTPVGAADREEAGVFGADVVAYPPAWRVAAAVLAVVARGSLLLTLAVLIFSDNPPTNPLKQMRLFAGLFAAPELAAWCVRRAYAARARVGGGLLLLEQRDQRMEIPIDAVVGVLPWTCPLPRGGLWLRLRSGRRFSRGFEVADPVSFVHALVAAGASPALLAGLESRMVVFSLARLASPVGRFEHPVIKFVLFSLVPTVPVFRLHQYITYGGTFGEYYTFGLQAYLLAFGIWWVSWSLNLLYVAAAARAVVEAGALAAAVATPSYAAAARRVLEWMQRILYYVGIPTWLALRLLA